MDSKYNKCCIVQDLIPMYIDNLASIESRQYIEEHIRECYKCKNILEKMQTDLKRKI